MGVCVTCVHQDERAILETCGAFSRIAEPGCVCLPVPCVFRVAGKVNTRITPIAVKVETKTLDNVFIDLIVEIQFQIKQDKIYEAYYTLAQPIQQIRTYVFDSVRAFVPKMTLDQTFESKQDIAMTILSDLREEMGKYGFEILYALVVDIQPDSKVKDSMNEINANRRLREAAVFKGEANKVYVIKAAEAESESQYLQGEGIAKQRKAIVEGLKDAVEDFPKETGIKGKDATDLILVTQYFDMIKEVAKNNKSKVIFFNQDNDEHANLTDAVRQGVLQSGI